MQAEGQGFDPPLLHQVSIGIWCNGNTADFDSVILGSSPSIPANHSLVSLMVELGPYTAVAEVRFFHEAPIKLSVG